MDGEDTSATDLVVDVEATVVCGAAPLKSDARASTPTTSARVVCAPVAGARPIFHTHTRTREIWKRRKNRVRDLHEGTSFRKDRDACHEMLAVSAPFRN